MASALTKNLSTARVLCPEDFGCGGGGGLKIAGPFVGVSSRSAKMRQLKMSASGRRESEPINGKRVNGVHVVDKTPPHLKPPPGGGGKNSDELLKDFHISTSGEEEAASENNAYLHGKFAESGFIFRQSFVIRSYEIGPDKTATMETIMNLLQETALNHVSSSGVGSNGFGATREMSIRKLIWVVTRIHIQVEKYSSWGDVVEIETWVDSAGKNAMRRDWVIRDYNTQKIITRATSTWVIMNRETRKFSRIPDEVKREVYPFYLNRAALSEEDTDSDKIEKLTDETAERVRSGLAPRWSDMDANQHVNNVRYIGWILESVPIGILEDCRLTSMTLEYRRECRLSNVLESLTSMKPVLKQEDSSSNNIGTGYLECTHLLRMQADEAEIVRARTIWHFNSKQNHTSS